MPSLKPSLPYGQVPLLEVDGDTICQSMAIARYLASECGLAGSSSLVKAQVDEVVDVMNDLQDAMVTPLISVEVEGIQTNLVYFHLLIYYMVRNTTDVRWMGHARLRLTRMGSRLIFSGVGVVQNVQHMRRL